MSDVSGQPAEPVDPMLLARFHASAAWRDGYKEGLKAMQPAEPLPEGCTPADAAVLRRANHALAQDLHITQEALADLHRQVSEFTASYGEADFYTGAALAVLSKGRPDKYCWPYSSPTADEAIAKLLDAARTGGGK